MDLLISSVTKNYGNKMAVDKISFNFKPGIYALLGPNGAGKSTLMRMICCLERPDKGKICFEEKNIQLLQREYFARLGYLPQNWGYYPQFTVKGFLNYFSVLKGIPTSYSQKEIAKLLELFNLKNMYNKKIKTLSGGMVQRLGIAQALLGRPDILILDEPTVGLDPKERLNFRNILSDYSKDKIIIISTHIVSDIEMLADKILIISDGKIIQNGKRCELVKTLHGKVWEYEADNIQNANIVISTISTRHDRERLAVRVLSENKPFENAIEVEATLEDVYFSHFFNNAEEN